MLLYSFFKLKPGKWPERRDLYARVPELVWELKQNDFACVRHENADHWTKPGNPTIIIHDARVEGGERRAEIVE